MLSRSTRPEALYKTNPNVENDWNRPAAQTSQNAIRKEGEDSPVHANTISGPNSAVNTKGKNPRTMVTLNDLLIRVRMSDAEPPANTMDALERIGERRESGSIMADCTSRI